MKKSLIKNNLKEIVKTRRRFLSIMIMAFLGVGFFAGLSASGPDMEDSLDSYVDESNMYDIKIISTLGLTDEDISSIKNIDEIENAYGLQTKDTIALLDEKENVCKVIEYNKDVNIPHLIRGSLPSNSFECVIDSKYIPKGQENSYIGKKITLKNDDVNEDDSQVFNQKELKIVGIVASSNYIYGSRGNTTIGNGTVSYFIYTKDDIINMNCYTEVAITIKGAKNLVTNSDKYLSKVNSALKKVEAIKEERELARYNNLIDEANTKFNDAQTEYQTQKENAEKELKEAEDQINQAKQELQNAETQIANNETTISTQEKELATTFSNAETDIANAEKILQEKESQFNTAKKNFEKQKSDVQPQLNQLQTAITQAENSLRTLQNQKALLEQNGQDTSAVDALIAEANSNLSTLRQQKQNIENSINSYESQIKAAEAELTNGKQSLANSKTNYATQKETAYAELSSAKTRIQNAKAEVQKGKQELSQKEQEFLDGKREAEEKLLDAESQINDAKDKISQIEKATWYIQTRKDNEGYINIFDAIKTMFNIATVFPVIFYLVAILISLTSMARMIEEERIEIGTLKSLGYTNWQIISKYILYSALACIIGGIIGMSIGFYLLPTIVWSLYSTIYTIPDFHLNYELGIGLLGTLFAFGCIGGATIIVAYKELKEMPSVLMRPKAPKNGKKVLLEKITFIWKKLNFSQKITVRNIFRYKKRALMTIIGIAGCTGLMVTGFGIKDSIIDIPSTQFGTIFKYDANISLTDSSKLNNVTTYLENNNQIETIAKVNAMTGKLKSDKTNFDVTVMVPDNNEDFLKACDIRNAENQEPIDFSKDGIIVSDKTASLLGVKAGDYITFIDGDNVEHKLKISQLTDNYIGHYTYMSKEFYNENIKTYKTNLLLVNAKKGTSDDELKIISEELLEIDGVASVSIVSTMVKAVNDMLGVLNYVVIILVVASALLAFVVLYNLANINIGERQRELATLKVLGFYDKEVDNYINKENIIFTIIGILLGLVFGFFLTSAVVKSVEIDKLKFIRQIHTQSYIYSSIITFIFSFIVNKVIHFTLKKINMIESLKSVE